jgi:ribonuclease HI
LIARILELAHSFFSSIKRPVSKRKKKFDITTVSVDHDDLVRQASADTVICYSDGSASPNPGPCGAGVTLFLRDPDLIFDHGASLGLGSNNYAELYALGVIFVQILDFRTRYPRIDSAIVFSDSKLALNAAVTRKAPLTNGPIIRALRRAHDAVLAGGIKLTLQWIRGHASIGGNERVDKISKAYAGVPHNSTPTPFRDNFSSHLTCSSWSPGFPLTALPSSVFLRNLPHPTSAPSTPSAPTVLGVVRAPSVLRRSPRISNTLP